MIVEDISIDELNFLFQKIRQNNRIETKLFDIESGFN